MLVVVPAAGTIPPSGPGQRGEHRRTDNCMMANEGLRITSRIVIPPREIELRYTRSGGPGGQNPKA